MGGIRKVRYLNANADHRIWEVLGKYDAFMIASSLLGAIGMIPNMFTCEVVVMCLIPNMFTCEVVIEHGIFMAGS